MLLVLIDTEPGCTFWLIVTFLLAAVSLNVTLSSCRKRVPEPVQLGVPNGSGAVVHVPVAVGGAGPGEVARGAHDVQFDLSCRSGGVDARPIVGWPSGYRQHPARWR